MRLVIVRHGETGNRLARIGSGLLRVRWFVRAPIWVYRARLGGIFGPRLLMLEHVGRNTGQRRFVVLEVVDHPTPNRYIVVSGFGTHAQWFRNVEATPQVRVYLANHASAPATAHRLEAASATAALGRYAHAHPRAWAKLRPILEDTLGTSIDEHSTQLPMIAIDVVARRQPVTAALLLSRSFSAPFPIDDSANSGHHVKTMPVGVGRLTAITWLL